MDMTGVFRKSTNVAQIASKVTQFKDSSFSIISNLSNAYF